MVTEQNFPVSSPFNCDYKIDQKKYINFNLTSHSALRDLHKGHICIRRQNVGCSQM